MASVLITNPLSHTPCTDIVLCRDLIQQFGWNSTCFQILNPGMSRWVSRARDAAVGFVLSRGMRIVAGAPVCAEDRLADVVREFERASATPVCYFGAESRLRSLLREDASYALVSLGAQPVWRPKIWVERFDGDASLRSQRNRAVNKGVRVSEWSSVRAENHPGLNLCLEQWLTSRGLPPLHFLVEPQTLGLLSGRRIFVAERDGIPVSFVILSPVPNRRGWLTEQFVRGSRAPNGTMELTLDYSVRTIADGGDEYFTMGMVPFVTHEAPLMNANPFWLRTLMAWSKAHGGRFYDFQGLDFFKSKFHPESWETIHAISREPNFSLQTLFAIVSAFTQGSPLRSDPLKDMGRENA